MERMRKYKVTEAEEKIFDSICTLINANIEKEDGTRVTFNLEFFGDDNAYLKIHKLRFEDNHVAECDLVYDNYFKITKKGMEQA